MAHLEGDRSRSASELEHAFLDRRDSAQAARKHSSFLNSTNLLKGLPAVVTLLALLAWEIASRRAIISPLFFPPPTAVTRVAGDLLLDGALFGHAQATLGRLIMGLALGGVSGYLLGLLMGWSKWLERLVDPFVSAAHPIPKIAIFPLFLIIFGINETSRILVVAFGTFFPLLINSMTGVRQIHPIHFEVARNYGAGPGRIFRKVILPGSLPLALTGLRLSLNVALLLTISIEIIGSARGLGSMIWRAWQTMRTEELFVSLGVIMLLGMGINLLVGSLEKWLMPWHVERKRI